MLRPALPLLGLIGLLVLVLGGASGGALGDTATPSPLPTASPSPPDPSPSPLPAGPSLTPAPMPTATPSPPPHEGPLQPGDWVQVTGTGDCLNVRAAPGLTIDFSDPPLPVPVYNCLRDGFVARLAGRTPDGVEMPVFREGYWWWRLLGQGWVAENWLAFHHSGGFPWPERPDLAGAGLIAYQGSLDGSIWLMNADGSAPRKVAERRDANEYISAPEWSPEGSRLAFTATGFNPAAGSQTVAVRIIDVTGALLAEFPGISQPAWSPDGSRLAGYRFESAGALIGQYAVPVVLDLASGAATEVGPHSFYYAPLAWSPDGGRVAFLCTSASVTPYSQDGQPGAEVRLECGGDGLRTVRADGSDAAVIMPVDSTVAWYGSPNWSPDGASIALASHSEASGCRGMLVVDSQTGAVRHCLPFPALANVGGRCGGAPEGGARWSPDSRYLVYSTDLTEGTNGVIVRDLATGTSTLIPAGSVWAVSLAPDGRNVVYGAEGYIFAAGSDGSNVTLLGEGLAPAWQPAR